MILGMITRQVSKSLPLMNSFSRSVADQVSTHERCFNKVQLLGRTGGQPQKRGTPTHPVVTFSLATNVTYTNDGVREQRTDWHRICVFRPGLIDTVYDFLKKGQRVYVTGRVSYGEITNEAGQKVNITSIIAEEVIMFK